MKKKKTKAVALPSKLHKTVRLLRRKVTSLLVDAQDALVFAHQNYFTTPDERFVSDIEASNAFNVFQRLDYVTDCFREIISDLSAILKYRQVVPPAPNCYCSDKVPETDCEGCNFVLMCTNSYKPRR